MISLIQRVTQARVSVAGEVIGAIDHGLLAFIAIQPEDTEVQVRRMVQRLLGYRCFSDADDRMNVSLVDTQGGLLLVPQFTLAADTRKGMRPSFVTAAPPAEGERLFAAVVTEARRQYGMVETGRFGADMQVSLVNDGPVTFWLEVRS